MKCKHSKVLLADYLDNGLSTRDTAAVKEHLESCAQCREELNFLKNYKKEMARYPIVNAPDDFLTRLHQRIDGSEGKKSFFDIMFFPLKIKLPLEAAGVSALALIAVLLFNPFKPENRADKSERAILQTGQKKVVRDASDGVADSSLRRTRPALIARNEQKATKNRAYAPAEIAEAAKNFKMTLRDENISAGKAAEQKEISRPESGDLTLYLARNIAPGPEPQIQDDRVQDLKKARKDMSSEDASASLAVKGDKAGRSRESPSEGEAEAPAESEIEKIVSSVRGTISGKLYEGGPGTGRVIIVDIPVQNYSAFIHRLSSHFSVRGQGTEKPPARSEKIRIRLHIMR